MTACLRHTRVWAARSGWCVTGQHGTCPGAAGGIPCCCRCHRAAAGAAVGPPTATPISSNGNEGSLTTLTSQASYSPRTIAEKLRCGSDLATEVRRLVAATRNTYGEVHPHAGNAGTLAAVQDEAGCLERRVGDVR